MTTTHLPTDSRGSSFASAPSALRRLGKETPRALAAKLTAVVAVAIGMLVAGRAIALGGAALYATVAIAGIFALSAWVAGLRRCRELSVWLVILVGVFNFTPALFEPINLNDEPLTSKLIKDGAVLVLLAVATGAVPTRSSAPLAGVRLRQFAFALAVMTVLMLIDLAYRGDFILGFLVSFRYYVIYPLAALAVIYMRLRRTEITTIVKGLVLLGALEGIVALCGFLGIVGNTYYEGYVVVGADTYSRAIGTLGNPNNLGLFLGLPAMLLLHRAAFGSVGARVLLGVPIALGIVLSFSKTAALAFALALLLQRSAGMTGRGRYIRGGFIGILGASLAYLAVKSRSGAVLRPEIFLGSRVETVPDALAVWTSSATTLFFGHGFGLLTPSQFGGTGAFAGDNMLLTLALEGGAVALAGFGLLVISACRLGAPRAVGERRSNLESSLWGYVLFFLCYAPVADNFRLFPGALLFWIAIGLLVSWRADSDDRPADDTSDDQGGAVPRLPRRSPVGRN